MELITNQNNNLITSTRKKRQNNSDNKSLFEIYKSPKTLKDYQFYLLQFLHFVYEGEDSITEQELIPLMVGVEEADLENYLNYLLNEKSLKKTSINKIMSSLKSLYNELEKFGYTNPLKFWKLFKTSRNIDNILKLSYTDIEKIIGLYQIKDYISYRNITILYALAYTGMRSQELLKLKFSDIIYRGEEGVLRLTLTKSGKDQYKPVHSDLMKKLSEYKYYVMSFHNNNEDKIKDLYIFSKTFDSQKPMSYSTLYNVIKSMGKLIGKSISPHNIRHAVATELSLNGADLMEIKDFLGHSDTRVTEVYINAKSLLEKRALDKLPTLSE